MKALLLNPISLIFILSISVVYFLILLHFSSKKRNVAVFERLSIVFFLFLLSGPQLLYLPYLNPRNFSYLGIVEGQQQLFMVAQILFYLVWIFVLRISFRGFFKNAFLLFKDPFLGSLLLLTILSFAWSNTPLVTLIGATTLLGIAAFAAHIAQKYDWLGLSSLLRRSITIIALLSVPVALLLPSIGRLGGSWNGILGHKNPFGALMALGAVLWYLSVLEKAQNRKLEITLTLILVVETFLSTSGGAISTLLLLFSLVLAAQTLTKLERRSKNIFILFMLILIIPICCFLTEIIGSSFELLGKDTSLTGRGDFWPQVIEAISKRPLLGYGYMGFWQVWRGEASPSHTILTPNGWMPEQPHNGFLDLGTSLGYLGLTLMFLSILKNLIYSILFLRKKQTEPSVPLIILLYVLLRNFSETSLWTANLDFFFYILLTVRLNLEVKSSLRLVSIDRTNHTNAW